MPPLAEFDVRPSVRRWMAAKDRRERIPVKATTQAWFKSTFKLRGGRYTAVTLCAVTVQTPTYIINNIFVDVCDSLHTHNCC